MKPLEKLKMENLTLTNYSMTERAYSMMIIERPNCLSNDSRECIKERRENGNKSENVISTSMNHEFNSSRLPVAKLG